MTAGGNYWPGYTTGQTWLFDMGMTAAGDVAVDAHRFANYLWGYLSDIPPTDTASWSMGNLLTRGVHHFTSASAPSYDDSPQNGGDIAMLSVGKNGNWPGQQGFPMQIFDAVRDFTLNVLVAVCEAHMGGDLDLVVLAARAFGDDNDDFRSLLSEAGIHPAAWASRYARNFAVSQARDVVRLSQQKLVMDDLVFDKVPAYLELVQEINRRLRTGWNGYIWPYDTMMALSSALSNMSRNPPDSTPGVQIVTSTPSTQWGYEDPVTAEKFAGRLSGVMAAMLNLGYIHPDGLIPDVLGRLLSYRRVDDSADKPVHANHSKMVIVDDAVCYIGSDNAYPAYLEEFGVWIDDRTAIRDLVERYWTEFWSFAGGGHGGRGDP